MDSARTRIGISSLFLIAIALFSLMLGCNPANEQAPTQDDETGHHVTPPARKLVSPPAYHLEDGEGLLSAGQVANRASNRVASLSVITNLAAHRTVSVPLHDWQPSTTTAQALVELMLRQTDPAKAVEICMIYLVEDLGPVDDAIIDGLRALLKKNLATEDLGEVHSLIATCYNKQGCYHEALEYLNEVWTACNDDTKAVFTRPFSHAKLRSYFGVRQQLKKMADEYSVEQYYAQREQYEAGIKECAAIVGVPWTEYDATTFVHERFERYLRMKPESKQRYMESIVRACNDKNYRSDQHRSLVLLKEMIAAHEAGISNQ